MKNKFGESTGYSSFSIRDIIRKIRNWIKAGDPPPKSQVKSLYLIAFLFTIGFSSLIFFILSYFQIHFVGCVTSLIPVAFISFLTLTPSVYGIWVSYCCWRRVYGYDWFMIPNYD